MFYHFNLSKIGASTNSSKLPTVIIMVKRFNEKRKMTQHI